MAFTTGTATDYLDLLDKLRLYLVAQGWTQLQWTAGTVSGGGGSLHVRGPGAGAGREVFVEIYTEANVGAALYAWRLRGAVGYEAGVPEGLNVGCQPDPSYLNLWQNSINYWFFVNDRRFIVVAKLSTNYLSAYAGFLLPFAVPANYPFPLYVAGNYGQISTPSEANSANRFFADPGGNFNDPAAMARGVDGNWIPILNHDYSSSIDNLAQNGRSACGFIWPFSTGGGGFTSGYEAVGGDNRGQTSGGLFDNVIPTRQSEYGMFPLSVHAALQPPFGVLDGVYAIPGTGLSTEQLAEIGARDFRLFQNIGRNSANDFIAIEEI